MASNSKFKKGKLYISNDLCIFKVEASSSNFTVLTNIKTNETKSYRNNEIEAIEMFLSNEKVITPSNFYIANQFITDLFLLSFSDKSIMVKTKRTYSNTIIYKKIHLNSNIDCKNNKFIINGNILLANKHVIITNIATETMSPIFNKYSRLFECL